MIPQKYDVLPVDDQGNWLLMLDVDGTLLDIAPHPDAVTVPTSLKKSLGNLHETLPGALILVSGRSIANLDALFAPLSLNIIGMHGAEYRIAGNVTLTTPPEHLHYQVDDLNHACSAVAKSMSGILVERKPLSVAIHYRARPDAGPEIEAKAQGIVQTLGSNWRLLKGKMVCEIMPASVSKTAAIRELLSQAPFSDLLPVYAGDDVTDENALKFVRDSGGVAIQVGGGLNDEEGLVRAGTPEQIREWLTRMALRTSG